MVSHVIVLLVEQTDLQKLELLRFLWFPESNDRGGVKKWKFLESLDIKKNLRPLLLNEAN